MIKTLLLTRRDIGMAAKMLREGKLAAFPIETVYSLGANALDFSTVKKAFKAKVHPKDNSLIVYIFSIKEIKPLAKAMSSQAKKLFSTLRASKSKIILCPGFLKTGIERTIMDRLERAAFEIIDVD